MARSPGGRCALLLVVQLLAVVSAVTPAPQTCWRCCPRCVTAKGPTCGGASRVGGIDARSLSLSPPDGHTQVPVTFPNWNLWVR